MRGLLLFLLWVSGAAAWGLGLPPRSVSTSRQFHVYCEDKLLRIQVTTFAEEMKSAVLDLLGTADAWKYPIVIQITAAQTAVPGLPPSDVHFFVTDAGPKIQIEVRVGDDPAAVALQPQVIRAVLLEYIHRETAPRAGQPYAEPPAWLVEAIAERERRRATGDASSAVGSLAEASSLPPVKAMLTAAPGTPGSAWNGLFRAYSFCLLDLLLEQPQGRRRLGEYLRDLRKTSKDPVSAIAKSFPALGGSEDALEKWWALSMARLAGESSLWGLSAVDTDFALEALLSFELPAGGKEPATQVGLSGFRPHFKDPRFKKLLVERQAEVSALATRANPLFRPIMAEYREIFSRLSRGKLSGLERRIAEVAEARQQVLKAVDAVADYLNWMEATQIQTRSRDFDAYFRAAAEASRPRPVRRNDPVTRYMNLAEAITK